MVRSLLLYDRRRGRGRLGLRLGRDRPLWQGHGFGPVSRLAFGLERSGVGAAPVRRQAQDPGRPSGRRRGGAGRAVEANGAEPVPLRRDRPASRDRLRPLLGDDRGQALPDRQRLGRGHLRLRQRRQARPLLRHRHAPAPGDRQEGPEPALQEPGRQQVSGRDRVVGPGLRGVLPRDRRRRHRQRRRSRTSSSATTARTSST